MGVAVLIAIGGMETTAGESSRMKPESAIVMAIVAFVFVRMSELQWSKDPDRARETSS